jgi:hypothetical protein
VTPTIGRIVHYTPEDENDVQAAIISDIKDGKVTLHVFRIDVFPIQLLYDVPFTEHEAGRLEARGHWSWPRRT